ncbi:MAG: nucleotidyltransferase [Chloroflexi bacterium]|nr:nucleotidyltransferase [Chloroflexota bacterium]
MRQAPPTLDELHARRDEILRVAAVHGASNVRIVGSVARQEATPTSDVDLLMTIPASQTVFDLVGLWLDLQELLGCAVSIIPDSTSDEQFLAAVLQDAVPL